MSETATEPVPALSGNTAMGPDDRHPTEQRSGSLAALIEAYRARTTPADYHEAGRQLAELLGPTVRRLARQVAKGTGKSDRDEFVDEALTFILEPRNNALPRITQYRSADGPLEGWLRTVLSNLWRSRQRSARRRPFSLGDERNIVAKPSPAAEVEASPFSAADLGRLMAWNVCHRIEVLCLAGLWLQVPSHLWEQWVRAYETVKGQLLPRPFPPEVFLGFDDPGQRTAPLARFLGYRPNTLSVRWCRARNRLKELDFVRELYG